MTSALLGLALIGGSVVFALVGVVALRSALRGRVREGHNDVLVPLLLTAGTIYAILLAFVVVVVWEGYGSAKANISDEASVLTTLYRQTNGMPNPEQRRLRTLLRAYTEAVVVKEWPLQRHGGASPEARKTVSDIYRSYANLPPSLAASPPNQEFVRNMSQLANDRNKRTLASNETIPSVLWLALVVGGLVVVGMTFLLYMERAWPHMVLSALLAGTIGLLLFVTVELSKPFSGPNALGPEQLEHALSVYQSVDQGM